MKAAFRVGIKPKDFWRLTPHVTTMCINAHNDNERDQRQRDLWVEWHNAYLNRVEKMPTLTELLKPHAPEEDETEVVDGKAAIDPVGRDLMNALLANFVPRFEDKPPAPKEE